MQLKPNAASRLIAVLALATFDSGDRCRRTAVRSGSGRGQHDGRRLGMGDGLRNGRIRRDRRACTCSGRHGYCCRCISSSHSVSAVKVVI